MDASSSDEDSTAWNEVVYLVRYTYLQNPENRQFVERRPVTKQKQKTKVADIVYLESHQ